MLSLSIFTSTYLVTVWFKWRLKGKVRSSPLCLLLRWFKIENESKTYIFCSLLLRWLKIESESRKYISTAMQRYPTYCSSCSSLLLKIKNDPAWNCLKKLTPPINNSRLERTWYLSPTPLAVLESKLSAWCQKNPELTLEMSFIHTFFWITLFKFQNCGYICLKTENLLL